MDTFNPGRRPQSFSRQAGRLFVLLSVLVALIIVFVSLGFFDSKQSNDMVSNKLTISGHPDLVPFSYYNNQALVGIGVDLADKIFANLDVDREVKYFASWNEVAEKASVGGVDVVAGIYQNKKYQQDFGFSSVPYSQDEITLFVAEGGNFAYQGWESLGEYKGAMVSGAVYDQELDDRLLASQFDIKPFDSARRALLAVSQGEVDYFIYPLQSGQAIVDGDDNLKMRINVWPEKLATVDLYLAIAKNSPYFQYLPDLSKGLMEQKQNAYLNFLVNKYKALLAKPPVRR